MKQMGHPGKKRPLKPAVAGCPDPGSGPHPPCNSQATETTTGRGLKSGGSFSNDLIGFFSENK